MAYNTNLASGLTFENTISNPGVQSAAVAGAGAAGGPLAAAGVAGGLGLIGGLVKARAQRRQQEAQLQAQKAQNLQQLELQKGQQQQAGFNSIITALRSAFLG